LSGRDQRAERLEAQRRRFLRGRGGGREPDRGGTGVDPAAGTGEEEALPDGGGAGAELGPDAADDPAEGAADEEPPGEELLEEEPDAASPLVEAAGRRVFLTGVEAGLLGWAGSATEVEAVEPVEVEAEGRGLAGRRMGEVAADLSRDRGDGLPAPPPVSLTARPAAAAAGVSRRGAADAIRRRISA
jgi:hypothetical protein